jgi:conjugative relaxase-like TrwC/TraI family protein
MRFTITPLGGGRRDIAKVVGAIVRYLQPPPKETPIPTTPGQPPGPGGPSRYYADSGEEAGRWLGRAAHQSGLLGAVQREDFASVLAGRDPHTGERLITAQGSAGRRADLGAGTHTSVTADGELLFSEADAAVTLGLTHREVSRMLDVGTGIALSPVNAYLGSDPGHVPGDRDDVNPGPGARPDRVPGDRDADNSHPGRPSGDRERDASRPGDVSGHRDSVSPGSGGSPGEPDKSDPRHGSVPGAVPVQPEGSYLVPVVDRNGSRFVTGTELARCIDAREDGTDSAALSDGGDPDDQFSIPEAARLAGVTSQYLRRLAKHHEDHRDKIDQRTEAGRRPAKAYLVAHRGTRDRWIVTRRELVAFLERRRPPAVRVGFDLTLTTEKSLGVLALLGGPDAAAAVLGSIQDGNDWAMAWLEQHAAAGRVTGTHVAATGWTVASFRHLTSRALDPFPHHHNVIANTITLPDGTRRALDARGLYHHVPAASALATAEMRHLLSSRYGVQWRPGRKAGWEIAGIDDRVLAEFSRRRTEIDDALQELEDEIGRGLHPAEIENVVLRTRPAKSHTPVAELIEDWGRRASRLGFDDAAIAAIGHRDVPLDEPNPETLFASLAAPDGICAGGSVFSRAAAIAALANHPVPGPDGPQPLLCGAFRLEALADEFLASRHVVPVTDQDDTLYTTVEMLDVQERIMSRFAAGMHQGAHLVSSDFLDTALTHHSHLVDEQRDLVRSWCASGHRYQAAIGRAGAGKTTSVAAAAEAWQAMGYRVTGAAVKGEAARTLAGATGIECETVAWYLAHDDNGANPFDDHTVLVVDEASTLSDRDLDRLMAMTANAGASMRLIGDPAQHGSIAAGGMFRVICEHHDRDTPELVTTHRLQDPNDRAAAEALREGHIDEAFDQLQAAGHLHLVADDLAMYRDVLARWWDAHHDGHDHPMVDRRNTTRRQLNRLAHLLRQVHGEIGTDEILATGDRRFSLGDRVTARAPNRDLHVEGNRRAYVRNGALGTVTAIHHGSDRDDEITVDFDGIGVIDLPRSFFDHHRNRGGRREVGIDHAYALTSYAVQGSTHDVSTSRVDSTTTRAETYVDITRGRLANHLYLTTATDPLAGESLPKLPPVPADQAVADRLQRSTGELTAWELHQPLENERPIGPEIA